MQEEQSGNQHGEAADNGVSHGGLGFLASVICSTSHGSGPHCTRRYIHTIVLAHCSHTINTHRTCLVQLFTRFTRHTFSQAQVRFTQTHVFAGIRVKNTQVRRHSGKNTQVRRHSGKNTRIRRRSSPQDSLSFARHVHRLIRFATLRIHISTTVLNLQNVPT